MYARDQHRAAREEERRHREERDVGRRASLHRCSHAQRAVQHQNWAVSEERPTEAGLLTRIPGREAGKGDRVPEPDDAVGWQLVMNGKKVSTSYMIYWKRKSFQSMKLSNVIVKF